MFHMLKIEKSLKSDFGGYRWLHKYVLSVLGGSLACDFFKCGTHQVAFLKQVPFFFISDKFNSSITKACPHHSLISLLAMYIFQIQGIMKFYAKTNFSTHNIARKMFNYCAYYIGMRANV